MLSHGYFRELWHCCDYTKSFCPYFCCCFSSPEKPCHPFSEFQNGLCYSINTLLYWLLHIALERLRLVLLECKLYPLLVSKAQPIKNFFLDLMAVSDTKFDLWDIMEVQEDLEELCSPQAVPSKPHSHLSRQSVISRNTITLSSAVVSEILSTSP